MGYVQSLCLSGKANEVPQVPNIICSGKLREKGVLGSVQGIGEEGTEPLCGRVADGDAVNNAGIPYTVAMLGWHRVSQTTASCAQGSTQPSQECLTHSL